MSIRTEEKKSSQLANNKPLTPCSPLSNFSLRAKQMSPCYQGQCGLEHHLMASQVGYKKTSQNLYCIPLTVPAIPEVQDFLSHVQGQRGSLQCAWWCARSTVRRGMISSQGTDNYSLHCLEGGSSSGSRLEVKSTPNPPFPSTDPLQSSIVATHSRWAYGWGGHACD